MYPRSIACALLLLGVLTLISANSFLGVYAQKAPESAPHNPHSALSPDWDPACYSTYDQIDAFLHAQAAQHPRIAALQDGGFAWEGTRHVWALTLTSSVYPAPKPGLFLVAGQHPRDIATTRVIFQTPTKPG